MMLQPMLRQPVTQLENTNPVDLFIGGYGSAGTLADEVVAITRSVFHS